MDEAKKICEKYAEWEPVGETLTLDTESKVGPGFRSC